MKRWQRHQQVRKVRAGAELSPRQCWSRCEGAAGRSEGKVPGFQLQRGAQGRCRGLRDAGGAGAGDVERLPSGHTHPEPRRLTERGQRASSSPVCDAERRAQTDRLLRRLPAPGAPISPAGLAEHNPWPLVFAQPGCPIAPQPSPFIPRPGWSPHFLTSGTDPWVESNKKVLIGREWKTNQPVVNVCLLCTRSRAAAGWRGGGSASESWGARAGPESTSVLLP